MTRIKRNKNYKTKFIGVRCTDEEYNKVKIRANLYTEGNLSEYVLYSSINFKVESSDLEEKAPAEARAQKESL